MKILIINPPHESIGSRMPKEHLPPLGLLSIAGPLIDAGHEVDLLDADFSNMPPPQIVKEVGSFNPEVVLMGHSGSTSAQPIIDQLAKSIKDQKSTIQIIVGGVFPTYHWQQILEDQAAIDFVVCGEGEQVCLDLVQALAEKSALENVEGIAFRSSTGAVKTKAATMIQSLDDYRVIP